MKRQNKKAEILIGMIIFLILNLVFLLSLLVFVWRSSTGAEVIEEVYAKKIALVIDSLESGMEINLSFQEVNDVAQKNKYSGKLVMIKPKENLIIIKAADSGGYSFKFFRDSDKLRFDIYEQEKKLIVKME